MNLTISTLAAIISSLAACVAIYFAWRSNHYAKQVLYISEMAESRKTPNLSVSFIDGFKSTTNDNSNYIFAFSVAITNKSDLPNTLTSAELVLSYRHDNDLIAKAVLPHMAEMPNIGALLQSKPLILPVNIDIRQTISEWLIFKIKKDHFKNASIESYLLRLCDSFGETAETKPLIINDILHRHEVA